MDSWSRYAVQQRHPDRAGEGKEVIGVLFVPRQRGQGLVEYALLLVLVALVVIVILVLLGPAIGNVFSNVISVI